MTKLGKNKHTLQSGMQLATHKLHHFPWLVASQCSVGICNTSNTISKINIVNVIIVGTIKPHYSKLLTHADCGPSKINLGTTHKYTVVVPLGT